MAKKRDAIFDELQLEQIRAIVGQEVLNVGTKMRYTEAPFMSDPNDIPSYQDLLAITGGGLSSEVFNQDDLTGSEGNFTLPYVVADDEAVIVMRVDYDDQPSQIFFPQYSFDDEAILGFTTKDNVTQIKVWYTGTNVVPPPSPPAPVFTLQPTTPVSVLQGKTLTLTVAANNATNYQWYKDGIPLAGQAGTTLTVPNFLPANAGTYYVQAIGLGGLTASNNAIVTNDVGVLVNNFTGTYLSGGSHTGLAITATDGIEVLNIPVGTNGRLRSSVTITISGYGTTKLTVQNGVGTNTNPTDNSQAFNSPVSSPLSVYSRVSEGVCYSISVPNESLTSAGNDLYIIVKRPGQSISSQPYYGYLSILDPLPGYTGFTFCSENAPQYKYGPSGGILTPTGLVENIGGACSVDNECEI